VLTTSNDQTRCSNDSTIYNHILGPQTNYNNRKVPGGFVLSTIEVSVQDFTSIEDRQSTIELDIYITEQWMDTALNYEGIQ
jgi:hypothetical protein